MKDDRLDVLLSAYLDGVLDPNEKLELEDQLRLSSNARSEFWAHTRMHAMVHEVEKSNAVNVDEAEESPRPRASELAGFLKAVWRRSRWPIALGGVAWVLLAVFFTQNMMKQKEAALKPVYVGELRHDLNAKWATDSEAIAVHQPIRAGTMHLQAGTIEVALVNGVLVAIQGPARFEFPSSDRLMLTQGRVSATVPPAARGFTVETPSSKVVDFGTRFGVNVDASGTTEAEVFEGKIDVSPKKNPKQKTPRRLTEDQAVRIDAVKHSIQAVKSDPSKFPQPERVTENLLADSSFENGVDPTPDGLPETFGEWGGDLCHVTVAEMGVQPHSGKSMLRFLRGENTRSAGDMHANSELWQMVDLRPYKKLLSKGKVEAELSGYFNRLADETGSAQRFGMNVFAFRGTPGDPDALWAKRDKKAVGRGHSEMVTDDTPATWQRLEAKMPVPTDADFLIVEIYAGIRDGLSAEQPVLAGNYADALQLQLRAAPRPGPAPVPAKPSPQLQKFSTP